jgi:hypothetical protein
VSARTAQDVKEEIWEEIRAIAPEISPEKTHEAGVFLDSFQDSLPVLTELSITPHDSTLGIMVKGAGDDFAARIREYAGSQGVGEDALNVFSSIDRKFAGKHILVKGDFLEGNPFDFTIYWQYLVPVAYMPRLVPNLEMSPQAQEFFTEASLLMRTRSAFLGMGFLPPDGVGYNVFFTVPVKKGPGFFSSGFSAMMARIGLSATLINYFIGFHEYLAPAVKGNFFISLDYGNERPAGVKIYYEIVPLDHTLEVMRALQIPPQQEERLKSTMEIMGMANLTYLGVRFSPGRMPRLKFYFNRRFGQKNLDNPESLADYITSTIWTPPVSYPGATAS